MDVHVPTGLVLTADLVNSTQVAPDRLASAVTVIAADIGQALYGRSGLFEFFRGDSFQAVLPVAADALQLSLMWRGAVRWQLPGCDVRLACGAGAVTYRAETAAQSAGPAFERSGRLLDAMKNDDSRLIAFASGDEALDNQLETMSLLAEESIRRWTVNGAEAVYLQLLHGETQQALASRMGIEQSSVHKRLQAAGWPAIRHWERYYRNVIASRLL